MAKKYKHWTAEEVDILREHYPTTTSKALSLQLPGRTPTSIRWKAGKLGLSTYRHYTPEEEDLIREHYPQTGTAVLTELLGRSEKAIHNKAYNMGITHPRDDLTNPIRLDGDVAYMTLVDQHGDPCGTVIVDTDALPLVSQNRWSLRTSSVSDMVYAARSIGQTTQTMHMFLMQEWGLRGDEHTDGTWHIDHANENGLDNRRENLSMMKSSLNQSRDLRTRSNRVYEDLPRGVTRDRKSNTRPIRAQIGVDGTGAVWLGSWSDDQVDEAFSTYLLARAVRYFDRRDTLEHPPSITPCEYGITNIIRKLPDRLDLDTQTVIHRLRILLDEFGHNPSEYLE